MATCPECGTSSRDDPEAIRVDPVYVAKPLGTWSLSGGQAKTSAWLMYRMSCRCGWSVVGRIDDEHFIVETPED